MATSIMILDDGEVLRDVKVSHDNCVEDGRREWYVFADSETAGKAARERWEDMARHDRSEFLAIVGEERLVGWALGESDSYGISSLEEFLDTIADHPEEELASYDNQEVEARINQELAEELRIDSDDSAEIDWALIRADIESTEIDEESFPADLCEPTSAYREDESDEAWQSLHNLIKAALDRDATEEWAVDLVATYTFQPAVAYRHN